ncbi:MAG: phosphopyruvate hydratase [Proteobacteria bacterium]|nr:phosphopyruvate hydratase [Pseudomonadota bacterium]
MVIKEIKALEVLDSRGNPTVEAHITLGGGYKGYGIAPSGASTGQYEALELRDHDSRYHGKGVMCAVENVNTVIASAMREQSYNSNPEFDAALCILDGTNNKSRLGANATIACSIAFARAAAEAHNLPLARWLSNNPKAELVMPTPMVNVINGGMHADNELAFQEFMIVPVRNTSFAEKVRMCSEVFHSLKGVLHNAGHSTNVGDEGGFAPKLNDNEEALSYILQSIEKTGYKPAIDFMLALDVAANSFYRDGHYMLNTANHLKTEDMIAMYSQLTRKFPILSIEDPLIEDSKPGWQAITKELGNRVLLVGDDLLVTNAALIEEAAQLNMANAVIIKPNQIGTISEANAAAVTARNHHFKLIASHRSGESEDTSIAHIAVAWQTEYIKTGSMSRTDRVTKYNELIRLEQDFI